MSRFGRRQLIIIAIQNLLKEKRIMNKSESLPKWALGPFVRPKGVNPVIRPDKDASFECPFRNRNVKWEELHVFNPTAVIHEGRTVLLYRAEDVSGEMKIGGHTSRIGLATSEDGLHFEKSPRPVLFPDKDAQKGYEWTGGCEDPRVVEREDGLFVMTYTQWNQSPSKGDAGVKLAVATSRDLRKWTKHGPAFAKACGGKYLGRHSKSGSIVCEIRDGRFIAVKIKGKYWMYWDNQDILAATSEDLIDWTPVEDGQGKLKPALCPRKGFFDSGLVEPGPQALLRKEGIVLLYNGMNATDALNADPSLRGGIYCAGQVLFDKDAPMKAIARLDRDFFSPEEDFERTGQYVDGTVFIEGLVLNEGNWLLYYGCADSLIGVARCEARL